MLAAKIVIKFILLNTDQINFSRYLVFHDYMQIIHLKTCLAQLILGKHHPYFLSPYAFKKMKMEIHALTFKLIFFSEDSGA